ISAFTSVAEILKQIGDQERKVKSEKDKLAKLYAERKILNPDKRFQELGKAAEEQVDKMSKGAIDQAKQMADNSPKAVVNNAKQGKSILETFQSTIDASDKAIGEADRET
ncbi:hypothetical protein, partial [Mesorhizobium sp. M1C.F.Ca.ET.188.01.1.1]|uniref:hypothetical protein n=1 Tax=Mesorhizobium sp. M1C.F.Ca.ET.188.01.1.1 TaxID=2563924 RepID=UPI0016783B5D